MDRKEQQLKYRFFVKFSQDMIKVGDIFFVNILIVCID